MDLGTRIKKIRNEYKLSQGELGKELGVQYAAVSKWERNENIPPLKMIYRMTKYFDISYDEMLEDIDFD